MTELTWEEIEVFRDQTYCRTKDRQVKSIPEALDFVNRVGFCFAFTAKKSELPCLWHAACGERKPVYPEHTHSDPLIGLVWEAKDVLPAQRAIYYGKALKKRPTMISLEFFANFYKLITGRTQEARYIKDYLRGHLSPCAKRIMEALEQRSPQVTVDLKLSSGYAHPRKRAEFDRAMAELQMGFYVCKIAEFYDPFTFLWDLLENRYAPEIEVAKELTQEQARQNIIKKYFENVWISEPLAIQRLFSWERGLVENALCELLEAGWLTQVPIRGEKKSFYAAQSITSRSQIKASVGKL